MRPARQPRVVRRRDQPLGADRWVLGESCRVGERRAAFPVGRALRRCQLRAEPGVRIGRAERPVQQPRRPLPLPRRRGGQQPVRRPAPLRLHGLVEPAPPRQPQPAVGVAPQARPLGRVQGVRAEPGRRGGPQHEPRVDADPLGVALVRGGRKQQHGSSAHLPHASGEPPHAQRRLGEIPTGALLSCATAQNVGTS